MGRFNDKSLHRIETGLMIGNLDPVIMPFSFEHAGKHNGRRDQMRTVAQKVIQIQGGIPLAVDLIHDVFNVED